MHWSRYLTGAVLALAIVSWVPAQAGPVTPPDLPPGSQYQLVFVTSGVRDATSSLISDYNTFVAQLAALSPSLPAGVTWKAIASTASVGASTNAPVPGGMPIYNTNWDVVGTPSLSRIYGGSSLYAPIAYDENGAYLGSVNVWTGTSSGVPGIPFPGGALGDPDPISGNTLAYLSIGWNATIQAPNTNQFHLYAISSPITYVPEPATLALFGLGLAGVIVWRRKKRRA